MTNGDLMNMVVKCAKGASIGGLDDIERNKHLCGAPTEISQEQLNAVLACFVNRMGHMCCMDMAFSVEDFD